MVFLRAAACAALFLVWGTLGAVAQDVTLTSRDGSVEITGTLLGFDGEFYRVETVYGELTVDGSGVLCDGPGCPNLTAFVAELRLAGAETMGAVLMPALIEAFALRSGLTATRQDEGPTRATYLLRDRDSGVLVGRFHIHATNTDEGFADLLANEADIVMSLREVRGPEAARALEAGMGDLRGRGRSRVLALDALVPVVAADNPLSTITTPDLARAFAGKIDNWQALGGRMRRSPCICAMRARGWGRRSWTGCCARSAPICHSACSAIPAMPIWPRRWRAIRSVLALLRGLRWAGPSRWPCPATAVLRCRPAGATSRPRITR